MGQCRKAVQPGLANSIHVEHLLKLVHLLSVVQMEAHVKVEAAQLPRTLARLSTDHENLSKVAPFHAEEAAAAVAQRLLYEPAALWLRHSQPLSGQE